MYVAHVSAIKMSECLLMLHLFQCVDACLLLDASLLEVLKKSIN